MHRLVVSVTPTGSTGAAEGSTTITPFVQGQLYGIYLDYASGVTSVTNVTIANSLGALFTLSDNATDGWYFPRKVAVDESGSATSGHSEGVMFPIAEVSRVSVSSSTPTADAVTVYVYMLT